MIHPTAIIHPEAKVDRSVEVGPYAVIDAGVQIGPGCILGTHVYVTGLTVIGAGNRFFSGCVVGEAPQDLKYSGQATGLRIGDHNVFREQVTIHRSTIVGQETVIGSHNFMMQHSHVAHNVTLGNHVIVGGGALIAGHARVADRAFISGNCLLHQFVSIGTLAMMQGGSGVSRDVAPYTMVWGVNRISGLNTVGLRRAGLSPAERLELRRLYHALFRSELSMPAAVAAARDHFHSPAARNMLEFIGNSRRGVCLDLRRPSRTGVGPGEAGSIE